MQHPSNFSANPSKKQAVEPSSSAQHNTSKRTINLEKYRKKLLAQVITIFLICLFVILERVFYQMIANAEEYTLVQFQKQVRLKPYKMGDEWRGGITNWFLVFFGELSGF
jgi:hypothetical protein